MLTESKAASIEDWESFLEKTCEQARTNPWLREECGSMLCEYVASSSKSQSTQDQFILKIVEKYSANGLLQTPEGVALWLTIQNAYPEVKLPKDVWHKRDPLHSKERSRLARILCDSGGDNGPGAEQKKIKGGTWKPQPNFSWHTVLRQAFGKFPSHSKLRQFCIEVLDSMFPKASSQHMNDDSLVQ
jgi:DNA polymerase phi